MLIFITDYIYNTNRNNIWNKFYSNIWIFEYTCSSLHAEEPDNTFSFQQRINIKHFLDCIGLDQILKESLLKSFLAIIYRLPFLTVAYSTFMPVNSSILPAVRVLQWSQVRICLRCRAVYCSTICVCIPLLGFHLLKPYAVNLTDRDKVGLCTVHYALCIVHGFLKVTGKMELM